jgi:hypothetical protein
MKKKVFFLVMVVCITFQFAGCSLLDPPTVSDIETILHDNYDDYTIINDFLVSSESRDIRIEDYSGKMQINGEEVSIENQAVIEALQRVMTTNGLNRVQKSGHTIDYQIWTRLSDASCGLAFSNAEGFEPTILYVTELVPLQYDGWYYYAEDYNEWRVNN